MRKKKKIIYAVMLLVVCFVYSAVSGETVKRVVSCPQDINEKEVMDRAISEGQKLGYKPTQEEGKVVLIQKFIPPNMENADRDYRITLAIVPGEDGRKAITIDGEATKATTASMLRGPNLDVDVKQIEKTVKKYLESK